LSGLLDPIIIIIIGTLVLRIGGPALLHAFSQQNKLPCASYIYKILHKEIRIKYSYLETLKDIIRCNLSQYCRKNIGFLSIKMGEIAIIPRPRWFTDNNEILGICYNHKHDVNSYYFETHLSVKQIKKSFSENNLHLAKEALFIKMSQLSCIDSVLKPIKIAPTCAKYLNEFENIIREIIRNFNEMNPNSKIINLATDGDTYSRNILNNLRSKCHDSSLVSLKYLSFDLVLGKYGVNFDMKHLIKRLRGILISEKRHICFIKRKISKTNLEVLKPSCKNLLKRFTTKNENSHWKAYHLWSP
jgi:hypothetical protein